MRKLLLLVFVAIFVGIIAFNVLPNDEPEQVFEEDDTNKEEPEQELEPEKPKKELYIIDRETAIPSDLKKITPEEDLYPPILHSSDYEEPIPMPGSINTAGAEDSPFILPCGCEFYFVFVPDVRILPEKQLIDGASGIYHTSLVDSEWSEPERVILNDDVSLDGCHFVQGDVMWFCSVRRGNYREVDLYTAKMVDGVWGNWTNVGELLNVEFQVGEMHLSSDGSELYFHSSREGGLGGTDIWFTHLVDGIWQEPENIAAINSASNEGMPFINEAGDELWFNKPHLGSPAVYVSRKVDGDWTEPELILSQFAGEPTLDAAGNLYFVHHYYKDGVMLEADIYVAYRKEYPLRGVGVSPKSFSADDFQDFLHKVGETQDVLLWAGDWIEIYENKAPRTFTELAQQYNYVPIIEVGHYIQETGELYRPLEEYYQLYLESTLDFVTNHKPAYFGIGVETNIFAEKKPEAFEKFIPLYNQVYDAIKDVSPYTKVFTVFQLETMKGLDMWESKENYPHWDMIDRFKLDVVAFTTYPGLFYRDVSDIPADHYSEILSYVSRPVVFTEIGWHSADSPTGWESSESEQAEFINKFFELTENLDTEVVVWSFMYDPDIFEPFNSMGLITQEDHERLAWSTWNTK